MNSNYNKILFVAILTTSVINYSCKKSKTEVPTIDITGMVLTDFTNKIALPQYKQLETDGQNLFNTVTTLSTNTTDANLTAAQNAWRTTRATWETCEGFLFGPVEANQYDPTIDDWPVNKTDLDSVLNGSNQFTQTYIGSLQTTLKGFHPLEYILFGTNGGQTATQITPRQKDYMVALAQNIASITSQIRQSWDASSGNFAANVINAGSSSSQYKTKQEAYLEIVNAMSGICDEVANEKINTPYISQNPALEESQFSKNSFTDFANNIKGAQIVYLGNYNGTTTVSISNWVAQQNLALDNKIKQQFSSAVNSFTTFATPFGDAIINNHTQILATQKALNDLNTTLQNDLVPLIKLKIVN